MFLRINPCKDNYSSHYINLVREEVEKPARYGGLFILSFDSLFTQINKARARPADKTGLGKSVFFDD